MVSWIVSLVSPGSPTMKVPWMVIPRSRQSLANWRARSTFTPFLMLVRICWLPDSKPTSSRRRPLSRSTLSVS